MGGLFMPDNYVIEAPQPLEMNIASLVWGMSLGLSIFTFAKACRQTYGIWKRKRGVNAYIVMVWIEWTACLLIGIICWFYLWGSIPPSFALFFSFVTLWVFQSQCIIQIILNRIVVLVYDKRSIRWLRWGTVILMSMINISVYVIWIPSHLQVSKTFDQINGISDRVGNILFTICDVALNIYFIHLMRSNFIANGLDKYNKLVYFNIAMIGVSLSLDVILIVAMSIASGFFCFQFHSLVHGIKLYIEMNLAELIAKTVRDKKNINDVSVYHHHSSTDDARTGGATRRGHSNDDGPHHGASNVRMHALVTGSNRRGADDEHHVDVPGKSIQRTVETRVVHEYKDDDAASHTSSTEQLQRKFGI